MPELLSAEVLFPAVLAALAAGFVTGFAGFGTGLVAAGLWLHVLPPLAVPPLVAIASVAAQLVGFNAVRHSFRWDRARPYLIGAVVGLPLGIWALKHTTPDLLRTAMGIFLVLYATSQITGLARFYIAKRGGKAADAAVGAGGGFLGGFAGLSGPLPLVWLQLRGATPDELRAVYQPFNLLVLAAATLAMAIAGRIDVLVLTVAAACLPATLLGAWLGARAYHRVDPATFRRIVLGLLLLSGAVLLAQGF